MKRGVRLVIFIAIIVVLALAVYFTFFSSTKCGDYECFNSRLQKCSRASFQYEGQDATWYYQIKGKQDGKCEVYTELRQIKQGQIDIERLQGQSMNCFLPLGITDFPEKDITRCHGELKESLQDTIIQKLHAYIISNLGQISDELKKPAI